MDGPSDPPTVSLRMRLCQRGVWGKNLTTMNPRARARPTDCIISQSGGRNTSISHLKSGVGHTSTIAQKIEPIIRTNPKSPGSKSPGTTSTTKMTKPVAGGQKIATGGADEIDDDSMDMDAENEIANKEKELDDLKKKAGLK